MYFYRSLILLSICQGILGQSSSQDIPRIVDTEIVDFETPVTPAQVVEIIKSKKKIKLFMLAGKDWTSENFNAFTKMVSESDLALNDLIYLDLSENRIGSDCIPSLLFWLKLTNIKFINLVSTKLSLKHVQLVYAGLIEASVREKKALEYMKKIIFVSQSYLSKASSMVQIYTDLVSDHKIPKEWAEIHRQFYASEWLKNYTANARAKKNAQAIKHLIGEDSEASSSDLQELISGLSTLNILEDEDN
jgi:hypothetical protein